jgi:PKD repeat protein
LFFVTQNVGGGVVTESTVWRSIDYGQSFDKDDSKFDQNTVITTFYVCPNNKLKLIFIDLKKPAMYVTRDEGTTFKRMSASFHATNIQFHPEKEDWLIAQDDTTNKCYVSTDLGTSWRQLATGQSQAKIYRAFWGVTGIDKLGTLYFELSTDGATAALYEDNVLVSDGTSFQVFTGTVHGFSINSLEVIDEYMFVHIPTTQYKDMYRSYNRGSFEKAFFATQHPFQDFFVIDATEHQMFVAVYHYSNLTSVYTSDTTGRFFTLSIDNVVSAPSVNWLKNNNPYIDFYRVPGLQGIYVANQKVSQDHVQTLISFNKGGDWQALLLDSTKCTKAVKNCRVHLHMSHGSMLFGLQDIFLSPNGIGLIMAHGDIGDYLDYGQKQLSSDYQPTLMVSGSAGVTWYKALTGSSNKGFDFLFGDHGSYMAATDHYRQSTTLHYSCLEGKQDSWKTTQISSSQLIINGMFTEPGETTEIAMVFCSKQIGSYAYNWAIIQVNFSQLFTQKCGPNNYEQWVPYEEVDNSRCLLGQRSYYERRKHDSCCYNGRQYVRKISHSNCHCTREDYECDYGYIVNKLDPSQCVRDKRLQVYHPSSDCIAGQTINMTVGYRRVAGDQCQGGNVSQWLPQPAKCPPKSLRLTINSSIEGSAAAVGQQISFNLIQESGQTVNSLYDWKFGDGSPVPTFPIRAYVDHSYSTAGNYSLSVVDDSGNGSSVLNLTVVVYDQLVALSLLPPHAVTPNANVTFHCQPTDTFNSTAAMSPPQLGPIHYEWLFEDTRSLTLTRDNTVAHTFPTTGRFRVSVSAFNPVSTKATHVYITVYRAVATLRLGFTSQASSARAKSKDFDVVFSKELVQTVAEFTGYDTSRFEAFVLPSMAHSPIKTDLSVVAQNSKEEQDINKIIEKVKASVDSGSITVFLQSGNHEIRATSYHEVQVNDYAAVSASTKSGLSGTGIGIIIITILTVVIIITAVLVGFWYHRRYSRLQSAYSRLNHDSGVRLTLDDDSDDDSPLAKSGAGQMDFEDDDDDDKLLNDA